MGCVGAGHAPAGARGRAVRANGCAESALLSFNGLLTLAMLDACRACSKGSLTASSRSACCGGRAVRPTDAVQDQWFSGICLGGVR